MSLFDQISRQHYSSAPEGWQTKRLKFVADVQTSNVDKASEEGEQPVRLCNYTDVYYNDRITADLPFMEATATSKEIDNFSLKSGQVLITKDSEGWDDIGISALVADDIPGVLCGYHLAIFSPHEDKLDGGFLSWLCRADALNDQFKLSANGVTRFGLGQYPMKNATIGFPSLECQKKIASFLDDRTGRIDTLLAKKRTMLERLVEKRQAVITQAVTEGIERLEQPKRWPMKRLKFCASYNDETLPETTDAFKTIQYVEISDVSLVGGIENSTLMQFDEAPSRARRKIRTGDILISTVRTYLKAIATVPKDSDEDLIASTGFCVVRPSDELDADFAGWMAKSEEFIAEIVSRSVGVSYPAITPSQLVDIAIPVPDLETQRAIAEFLRNATAQIDRLCETIERSIDAITEYRSAIINAAVTGQIGGLN